MAEHAYGMARIEKPRETKEGWKSGAGLLSVYLYPWATQSALVHKKTAKLQFVSGPLLPHFVMCQDSGPTEVIESEHGGGVWPSGRAAAGKASTPSRLERAYGAQRSCGSIWRGDSAGTHSSRSSASMSNIPSCPQVPSLLCLRRHLYPALQQKHLSV